MILYAVIAENDMERLCGPLIVHFVMLYTGKQTDRVIQVKR